MSDIQNAVQETGLTGAQEVAAETQVPVDQSELHRKIVAQFDAKVDTKDFKFNFKTDKTGVKRPTVDLKLPVPSVEGIIYILEHATDEPKQFELLMDAVYEVISDQARSMVNENEAINQDNFPLAKVTWDAIANMPRAERRGGGIGKETWEEFAADYIEVMPAATNKTAEQVGNAAKLLVAKFNPVKTNKPVITALKDYLGIYVNVSPNAETYLPCVEFLKEKAEKLLNVSDEDMLASL